jgi:hypothetical protein
VDRLNVGFCTSQFESLPYKSRSVNDSRDWGAGVEAAVFPQNPPEKFAMAEQKQVMCITKRPSHHDPHERIQGIGGGTSVLARWWRAEDDAIRDIEMARVEYYVNVNNRPVRVMVAVHNGRKYLKTEADGYAPNNLLNLPECPPR